MNVFAPDRTKLVTVSVECELLAAGRFMRQTPAGHRIFFKSCKVVATTWKMPPVSTGGIVCFFFQFQQAVINERATLEGEQKREKERRGKRHETAAGRAKWKE